MELLKGGVLISIGFYGRKFVFFLAILALLIGLAWVIRNQVGFASGRPLVIPLGTDSVAVDMEIMDHGIVMVDGTSVTGAFHFFRGKDELRYLVLDQPDVVLSSLTIRLHFPRAVDRTEASARAILIYDPKTTATTTWLDDQTLAYTVSDVGPATVMTMVVELPKGAIQPSLSQRLFGTVRTLPQMAWLALAFILPIAALGIFLLVVWPQLRQRWSEPTNERPTPPENLSPALVSALVDGRVSARTIAATLLDLARRDYLEIGSDGGAYTFTKRRRLLDGQSLAELSIHERLILEKIFSQTVQAHQDDVHVRIGSSLFSKKVAEVYISLYDEVTRRGFFTKDPMAVQGTYRLAGLGMFFAGVLGFGLGAVFFNDPPTPLLLWIGVIAVSLGVISLAPHMPVYTPFGLRQRMAWLAFRNYLRSSKPIDYTSLTQEQFLENLPYAVALGVEVQWAERFIRAPFRLPDWYMSKAPIARMEDFLRDVLPMVGFLARDLAALKEPTLS